jgi:hypothetical protein
VPILETTVRNQDFTQEKIKRRLNSGNVFYHSIQTLLSSLLLSKTIKIRMYKTIILPVVLYGCETWSLTLREEHRLRVFENRVLRRIFGPKRDEIAGGREESMRMRFTEHVARMSEKRNAYSLLVGKPEGRRPLGRSRRRWLDNIMMKLVEVGWGDVDRIGLARDRDRWRALVSSVLNLRVP